MAVKLSDDLLKLYFNNTKVHRCYLETVEIYTKIKTHAEGLIPEKLINERRPSETTEILDYRKKIYVPKTKTPISKVIKSLSKIRRSQDWSIKYDEKSVPSQIVDGEKLSDYCEKNFPEHTSVTNWAFSHLLKNKCVDPNAIIAVVPLNPAAGQQEYYKPVPIIFNSDQVKFYEDGAEYAIFLSSEKSDLMDETGDNIFYQAGRVYYVLTTTEYQKWEEIRTGEFKMTVQLIHNRNRLPAWRQKSPFRRQRDNTTIQESHLDAMLADLDEAAREYSDLQAGKVQGMYPLLWFLNQRQCKTCSGLGKLPSASGDKPCSDCEGTGKVKFSPYAHIEVDPVKYTEKGFPFSAPAGYVPRDVDILNLMRDSVKDHLYDSLASVNMQFLDQVPLNVSGKGKEVDRDELNNFVYNVAEDMVADIDKVYWWTNEWRYSTIVPDRTKREAMLPKIPVPEKFELLPADYLMDEIGKGRTSKANPILIAAMEEDYASKKFYNEPLLSGTIKAFYELDPLPGLSVDEKMSLLQNKGITQIDFVISSYLVSFVKRAMMEDKDFLEKDYKSKMDIIKGYADEKIKENNAVVQVKASLQLPAGNLAAV